MSETTVQVDGEPTISPVGETAGKAVKSKVVSSPLSENPATGEAPASKNDRQNQDQLHLEAKSPSSDKAEMVQQMGH